MNANKIVGDFHLQEMQSHINILSKKYDGFNYAPIRTQFHPDLIEDHLRQTFPNLGSVPWDLIRTNFGVRAISNESKNYGSTSMASEYQSRDLCYGVRSSSSHDDLEKANDIALVVCEEELDNPSADLTSNDMPLDRMILDQSIVNNVQDDKVENYIIMNLEEQIRSLELEIENLKYKTRYDSYEMQRVNVRLQEKIKEFADFRMKLVSEYEEELKKMKKSIENEMKLKIWCFFCGKEARYQFFCSNFCNADCARQAW